MEQIDRTKNVGIMLNQNYYEEQCKECNADENTE